MALGLDGNMGVPHLTIVHHYLAPARPEQKPQHLDQVCSHLKHIVHCSFTLQIEPTAPKVEPANGWLSHLGKS
jgi:hypothetical protein